MRSARASALVLLAGLASSAHAQVINWNAAVSGSWGTAANWNPANVPDVATEFAVLGLSGPYVATLNLSPTIGALTISNPQAEVAIPASRTLTIAGNVANDGIIRLPASGSTTSDQTLFFSASAAITGAGSIRLEEHGDSVVSGGVGVVVTNSAGHTIGGRGLIAAALANAGLVDADSAGGTLVLSSNAKSNSGLMRASAGILEISGIALIQTGAGIVRADAGTVLLSGTGSISSGLLESTNAGVVHRESGTTTLNAVTTNGEITIAAAGTLATTGGLTNNGLIRALASGSTTSNATVRFNDAGTLTGPGEIRLEEATDSIFEGTPGATVTQTASHSIRGRGVISAEMANAGLIDANVSGFPLVFTTVGSTNSGTMRASSGGVLNLSAATITQSPSGVIRADAGTVLFSGTCAITGGTVESLNAGVVNRDNGTTTLTSVTTAGQLTVEPAGTLAITGTGLVNNGLIRALASGATTSDATIRFSSTGSLSGSGEIRLEENSDATFSAPAGTVVTQAASHKITGRGTINAAIVNDGLIDANSTGGTLDISGAQTNNALIRASNGGNIDLNGVVITHGPVGVLRADNAQIHFIGTCSVIGGTLEGINGGEINRDSGTTTLSDVVNNGLLTVDAAGTLTVPAPTLGSGLFNNGLIRLLANGSTTANETLTFTGGPASLVGTGEVRLEETNDAVISGTPLTQGSAHTISGIGQITTPLTNHGTIAPGNPTTTSLGTLSMTAGYTQSSSGLLEIELGGTAAGQRDRLTITGAASLAGTLDVTQINGHITPDCSEFIILSASGGITGTFPIEHLPAMALGKMHVVYGPTTVSLRYFPADINNDGVTDFFDYLDFVAAFDQEDPAADFNNDEVVDFFDYLDFVASLDVGC